MVAGVGVSTHVWKWSSQIKKVGMYGYLKTFHRVWLAPLTQLYSVSLHITWRHRLRTIEIEIAITKIPLCYIVLCD